MIAIDAMGGDFAPAATVAGALRAKREFGLETILVGREDEIEAELKKLGQAGALPIHPASEVVGMGEAPMRAIRRKPDSSIRVAFDLVREGRAEAMISAGNSGAVMACGVLILGRAPGIERPALATVFPSPKGATVVLDVGANVDSQPRHLLQFAVMGDMFARQVMGHHRPRIGLLSVGEEDAKGNEQTKATHDLLRASDLNFIGNVEGRDLFAGSAEVIVCDGFVGNVCLKVTEGTAMSMFDGLKQAIKQNWRSKLGAWLLKPALKEYGRWLSYSEYGGAPLLGVKGACLICHGASDDRAIMNAARAAAKWVDQGFYARLSEAVERSAPGSDSSTGREIKAASAAD